MVHFLIGWGLLLAGGVFAWWYATRPQKPDELKDFWGEY